MIKSIVQFTAVAAFATCAATAAQANGSAYPSTYQTGETAGLARGAPLPEGVYFVNTLDWGVRKVSGGKDTKLAVDIPVIAWSTPWSFAGTNLQILAATPVAHVDAPAAGLSRYGFYNPFLGATLAYDLGGGFGVSYTSGIYFNVGDRLIRSRSTTWRQDFAASYTGDGWNLTANFVWGITFDSDKGCLGCNGKTDNGLSLDLTATKTFGKWEIGAVGFASRTYDEAPGNLRRKQFALGPLVGYNFGPVVLQAFVTRDVYERNLGGKETRAWTRVIIPLWTPATPAAPLVTKY